MGGKAVCLRGHVNCSQKDLDASSNAQLDLKVDGLKGVFVQVERLLHDRSEELTKGWDAVQLHERVAILDEIRRNEGVIPLRSEIDRVVGREFRIAFVFPEVWCDATSHPVGFAKQGPTALESFVNPRCSQKASEYTVSLDLKLSTASLHHLL